jgi:periplasmic copper chaperone A
MSTKSALLLTAGLLASATVSVAQAAEPLQLSQAWVRAMPPTQAMTAGYLSAVNVGSETITVIGASSSLRGVAEIHTSRDVDGMVRMEQVSELTLAPGESVEMRPGGMHMMLLDLPAMPSEGDKVTLCLELAAADPVCTEAPVRRGGEQHSQHNHH